MLQAGPAKLGAALSHPFQTNSQVWLAQIEQALVPTCYVLPGIMVALCTVVAVAYALVTHT